MDLVIRIKLVKAVYKGPRRFRKGELMRKLIIKLSLARAFSPQREYRAIKKKRLFTNQMKFLHPNKLTSRRVWKMNRGERVRNESWTTRGRLKGLASAAPSWEGVVKRERQEFCRLAHHAGSLYSFV